MSDRQKFAVLRAPRRVWAIGAIHGEAARLLRLHDALWPRLEPCDSIVYLGNAIGRGSDSREVLDALLNFRREFLARPDSDIDDVVYLRGSQEEMWQKLLQLQFANDPRGVLKWMFEQGVDATMRSYGVAPEEALRGAATGTVVLTRWTSGLRRTIQAQSGHYDLMAALRRAAYSDDGALLFVNSGIDPTRPLETQSDSFWWSSGKFHSIAEPYGSFRRVLRGFDPSHSGFAETDYTVTVDGGCGFGGTLIAACVTPDGALVDKIEV